MSDIEQQICAFLADEAGLDSIDPGESLVESGLIDSAEVLNLVAFLEETFDLELDPADITLRNFDSVQQMAALVRQAQED